MSDLTLVEGYFLGTAAGSRHTGHADYFFMTKSGLRLISADPLLALYLKQIPQGALTKVVRYNILGSGSPVSSYKVMCDKENIWKLDKIKDNKPSLWQKIRTWFSPSADASQTPAEESDT